MASDLPAADADAEGMRQALCPVLPALPTKGVTGPQISLGQQAAATGWGKWQQGGGAAVAADGKGYKEANNLCKNQLQLLG